MQQKIYDYYKDLPPWAKGVVIVGVVGVVVYGGVKLARVIFPPKSKKDEKQLEKDIKEEIEVAQDKGLKPSYQDSNYTTFANTIYDSIRYCAGDDYGNAELTMKKMKNDLDVAKLIKAYGIRQRYCFGLPAGSKLDLFSTINAELGQEWFGLTNYRVRNINEDWKAKGITYQI
jgi:hypothetical protein